MRGLRSIAVAFVLLAALVPGAAAHSSSSAPVTIASATTSDFRVVLVATKRSGGEIPEARVTLRTFERVRGGWRRTGVYAVSGIYFWKTVTAPRAVCRLEIRTGGAQARFSPHAVVQLLLSPSLGCGRASAYSLVG